MRQFNNPSLSNPQYELVVLHPEHFLPGGNVLILYDPEQLSHKAYVPSPDRRLREFPGDLSCARFPSFSGPDRPPGLALKPLSVVINADIRFRRYRRLAPPSQPLPDDVLELMKQTEKLVELIYWEPEVKPGSYAEMAAKRREALRRQNPIRSSRPKPGVMQEGDVEMGTVSDTISVPQDN
jgi:hypothetical protein